MSEDFDDLDEDLEDIEDKTPAIASKTPNVAQAPGGKDISIFFMSTIGPGEKKQKLLVNTPPIPNLKLSQRCLKSVSSNRCKTPFQFCLISAA